MIPWKEPGFFETPPLSYLQRKHEATKAVERFEELMAEYERRRCKAWKSCRKGLFACGGVNGHDGPHVHDSDAAYLEWY